MRRDELSGVQLALVEAVTAEFDRVLDDIGPGLDKRPEPQFKERLYREVQAAQNALRTCIEATLERMMPYGETVPVELAIRMASYCLSALPIEAQEPAIDEFLAAFPAAHAHRIQHGIRIGTTWEIEGRERPNFPKADS